jgi:NTP pyrophosphatase (non-canonical NTP hydrolase)
MNRFLLIGLLMLKGICTTVAAPLLSVVTGTVQDASTGEAVIGAAVILQNTTYGAVADADGRFVINNVKPGTYTIEVQMLSYQRVVIEGCQIKPGENTLPLISLQPSAEEIDEVMYEARQAVVDQAKLEEEMGDLLFATVNLARHLGTKAEIALQKANEKFERRFREVERIVAARGLEMTGVDLETMEEVWQQVKRQEIDL